MLKTSTIQLLRIHFSVLLLPVFLFAISQVDTIRVVPAITVFFILHVLVYPSSNGYNSYMDRDTTPVGGIRQPLLPTRQLYSVTLWMDIIALLLSLWISLEFAIGILFYILASRAYSYRGIRLKRYPLTGFLIVIIFQGALIYYLAYTNVGTGSSANISWKAVVAAALLIGGAYPVSQIYQHQEDLNDNVRSISYLLGHKGTFIFSGLLYLAAFVLLFLYFRETGRLTDFFILLALMFPVMVFFSYWAAEVWKDKRKADFMNTMRMNLLASSFFNLAFIIILIRRLI